MTEKKKRLQIELLGLIQLGLVRYIWNIGNEVSGDKKSHNQSITKKTDCWFYSASNCLLNCWWRKKILFPNPLSFQALDYRKKYQCNLRSSFCSTSLPLTWARWARSTFSSPKPQSSKQFRWLTSKTTAICFAENNFVNAVNWTREAGSESKYAAPPAI